MEIRTKKSIVASSSIWVSILLNIIPGFGAGYLYQRRWIAYWITGFVSAFIVIYGQYTNSLKDFSDPALPLTPGIDFYGLIILSIVTSIEAGYKVYYNRNF